MGRLATLVVALAAVLSAATLASAQDSYPSRPITLIAPFAAGGSADLVSRILAEGLTARLGQSVIVDNKPGGNGVIGIREALRAAPDGYTLLLGSVGAFFKWILPRLKGTKSPPPESKPVPTKPSNGRKKAKNRPKDRSRL